MECRQWGMNTLEADLIADLEGEDDEKDSAEGFAVHNIENQESQFGEATAPSNQGLLSSIGDRRGSRSSVPSINAARDRNGAEGCATSLRADTQNSCTKSRAETHSPDHLFLLTQTGRSQVKALLASADRGDLLGGTLQLNVLCPPTPSIGTDHEASARSVEHCGHKTTGQSQQPQVSDQVETWCTEPECKTSAPRRRNSYFSDYSRAPPEGNDTETRAAYSRSYQATWAAMCVPVKPSSRMSDTASGDGKTRSLPGCWGSSVLWEATESSTGGDDEAGNGSSSDAAVQLDEPFLLPLLLKFLGVSMYGRLCCVSKSLKEACEGRYRRGGSAAQLQESEEPRKGNQIGSTRDVKSAFPDGTPWSLLPASEGTPSDEGRAYPASISSAFDGAFASDNGDFWLSFLRDHYPGSFSEELEFLEGSRLRTPGKECSNRVVNATPTLQMLSTPEVARSQASFVSGDMEVRRKRIERGSTRAENQVLEMQDRIQGDAPLDEFGARQRGRPSMDHEDFATGSLQTENGQPGHQAVYGVGGNAETGRDFKRRRVDERCPNEPSNSGSFLDSSNSARGVRDVGSVDAPVQGELVEPPFYRATTRPMAGNSSLCNLLSIGPSGGTGGTALTSPGLQRNTGRKQGQEPSHCAKDERMENSREGEDSRHVTCGWRNIPHSGRTSRNPGDAAAGCLTLASRGRPEGASICSSEDAATTAGPSSSTWLSKDDEGMQRSAGSATPSTALLREGTAHRAGRVSGLGDDIDPLLLCVSARLSCMILVTSAKVAEKWRELGLVAGWRWFQRNVLRRMTLSQLRQWVVKAKRASCSASASARRVPSGVAYPSEDAIDLPEGVARSSDHIAWKMTTVNWELFYESVQTEMGYRARMLAEKLFHLHQRHVDAVGQIVEDRFDLEQQLLCLPVFCGDSRGTDNAGPLSSFGTPQSSKAASDEMPGNLTLVPRWKRCVPQLRRLSDGAFALLRALNEAWDEYEEWAEMACNALDCLDFRITQEREACDQRWPHTPNLGDASKLQFRNFCVLDSRLMPCITASVYALIHELEYQLNRPLVNVSSNPPACSSAEGRHSWHDAPAAVRTSGKQRLPGAREVHAAIERGRR
ncbi:conserved hypothetical protein [Neospora caninum Liverpool]|nr:conserved hypothetical protein [Neospora caninum Liverpool]CBZ53530.1 conserved hypothetical protein [Neospora caninum Liverpool]|eukprot:XP_003883562.1 conserved hypothetical protein [Neospora caninum Liverpool]